MKKVFRLDEVDCANCALKMENAVKKLDGVRSVSVSFLTQKLTLEADDAVFDSVLQNALRVLAKVEPDCRVIVK